MAINEVIDQAYSDTYPALKPDKKPDSDGSSFYFIGAISMAAMAGVSYAFSFGWEYGFRFLAGLLLADAAILLVMAIKSGK